MNVYNPEALTPMNDSGPEVFAQYTKYWEERGYRTPAESKYLVGTGGPEGVAPWVAYLSSDESEYINGRVFAVESRRIAMVAQPDEERVLFHDYKHDGPWSLERLSMLAPLAFPVENRWPRRTGDELERWEKA